MHIVWHNFHRNERRDRCRNGLSTAKGRVTDWVCHFGRSGIRTRKSRWKWNSLVFIWLNCASSNINSACNSFGKWVNEVLNRISSRSSPRRDFDKHRRLTQTQARTSSARAQCKRMNRNHNLNRFYFLNSELETETEPLRNHLTWLGIQKSCSFHWECVTI